MMMTADLLVARLFDSVLLSLSFSFFDFSGVCELDASTRPNHPPSARLNNRPVAFFLGFL